MDVSPLGFSRRPSSLHLRERRLFCYTSSMKPVAPVTEARSCWTCKTEKPIAEFRSWRSRSGKIGYERSCLECARERSRLNARKYSVDNKERILADRRYTYASNDKLREAIKSKSSSWYARNREAALARCKAYAIKNKEKIRENNRWRNILRSYGLSRDDYLKIVESQGGLCPICREPLNCSDSKSVHVDHCHSTGKVRGILCAWCNKGLGHFRDNDEALVRAASYVSFGRFRNTEEC